MAGAAPAAPEKSDPPVRNLFGRKLVLTMGSTLDFEDERKEFYNWIATFPFRFVGKITDPDQLEEAVAHHKDTVVRRTKG